MTHLPQVRISGIELVVRHNSSFANSDSNVPASFVLRWLVYFWNLATTSVNTAFANADHAISEHGKIPGACSLRVHE